MLVAVARTCCYDNKSNDRDKVFMGVIIFGGHSIFK